MRGKGGGRWNGGLGGNPGPGGLGCPLHHWKWVELGGEAAMGGSGGHGAGGLGGSIVGFT